MASKPRAKPETLHEVDKPGGQVDPLAMAGRNGSPSDPAAAARLAPASLAAPACPGDPGPEGWGARVADVARGLLSLGVTDRKLAATVDREWDGYAVSIRVEVGEAT